MVSGGGAIWAELDLQLYSSTTESQKYDRWVAKVGGGPAVCGVFSNAGDTEKCGSQLLERESWSQIRKSSVMAGPIQREASESTKFGAERSAMETRDCTTAHVWLRYRQSFMSVDRFSVEYRTDRGGDWIRLRSRLIG